MAILRYFIKFQDNYLFFLLDVANKFNIHGSVHRSMIQ